MFYSPTLTIFWRYSTQPISKDDKTDEIEEPTDSVRHFLFILAPHNILIFWFIYLKADSFDCPK